MKTIKQMADSLGIDKQRVYRFIRKHRISEVHQEAGVMYYDDVVETQVQKHFSKNATSSEAHQTASNDAVIDTVVSMLRSELDIKNEQIRELNARLAESNAALVAAQQSAQAAQVLHAGTMKKQLTDGEAEQEPVSESKGFFGRWFGKKAKPE